ncbi:MAG: hypothetical protein Q7N87_00160 [Candidatus Uhrbacteria bacterium]|nr:hypothetical protein [Candidatus Uhrbacteria bacterium]
MPRLHFSFHGRTRSVLTVRLAAASILVLLASSFLIPAASARQFTRPKAMVQSAQKFTPIELPLCRVSQINQCSANQTYQSTNQTGGSTPMIGSFNDILNLAGTTSNGASFWLNQIGREGSVTVYRVEGIINAVKGQTNVKLAIDQNGMVKVLVKEKDLFLNFGDKERALTFFQRKLHQGMEELRLKSFNVSEKFLEEVRGFAVTEAQHPLFPDKPFIVDATKAADQFGFPPKQIPDLKKNIIKGSGKDLTEEAYKSLQKTGSVLPEVTLEVKNPGLIQKIGAWIQKTFPKAVEMGGKFLGSAGKVLAKLGPLFAVAGLFFGLMELGYSGGKLLELMQRDGILGALSEREGQIDLLHVLSGFFNAVSGGAFVLGAGIAATGIGLPVAAVVESVAVISMLLGVLFTGGALVLENLDAIKAAAKKTWDVMQYGAAKAYEAVANSAQAAAEWAKQTANDFVNATQSALEKAGKWVEEKTRFVASAVAPVVAVLSSDLPKAVSKTVETATRWVEKEVEQVREVIEKVTMVGERMIEKIVDVVKQVPRIIYETATRIVDKVVPVVRQVTDYVTTKVQETYQYATRVTRNVTEWVTEHAQEAYQVVRQVPRQIMEFVRETVAETKQVARTVYDRVTNYVTQWVQQTVPVVRQVARTVWDRVTNWIPQTIRTGWGRFVSWVTRWVPQVTQVARTVYDTVTDYVTRTVSRVVPVVTNVARTVYDTVTNWVTRTVPVVKTVYDTVVDTAYRWVQKPVQIVKQVVDTVWRTGTRLVDKVIPVVRQVTDYVTQKVQETYQVAKTVYDTVTEKVPQLVKETYEYVVDVPRKIVEKVKVMVEET